MTTVEPAELSLQTLLDDIAASGVSAATLFEIANRICSPGVQSLFADPVMGQNACYAANALAATQMEQASKACQDLLSASNCESYDCMAAYTCSGNPSVQQCSIEMTGSKDGLCLLNTNWVLATEGRV